MILQSDCAKQRPLVAGGQNSQQNRGDQFAVLLNLFFIERLKKKKQVTNKLQQHPLVLQTLSESQFERHGRHMTEANKKISSKYFCGNFFFKSCTKGSHKYSSASPPPPPYLHSATFPCQSNNLFRCSCLILVELFFLFLFFLRNTSPVIGGRSQ